MKYLNKEEKGHILVGTIMFVLILGISALGFLTFADYQSDFVERELAETQAVLNAEAGLETVLNIVRDFKEPKLGKTSVKKLKFDDNDFGTGEAKDLQFIGKQTPNQSNNELLDVYYEIYATGVFHPNSYKDLRLDPVERKLILTYDPGTFADFLYLTDKESSPKWENPPLDVVRFWYYDDIDGLLHSNDLINIRSNYLGPHFRKHVTTAADDFEIINEGGMPVFHDDYTLSAEPIPFSYTADLVRENSREPYKWVGNDCINDEYDLKLNIKFKSNGQMVCVRKHEDQDGYSGSFLDSLYVEYPDTLILTTPGHGYVTAQSIWSEMTVEVHGRVRGDVTVGSARNIRIVDDLTYADSPLGGGEGYRGRPPQGCQNYLGLISEMNVMVANTPENRHPQNLSFPGDPWGIVINAAICALGDGGSLYSGDWTTGGGSFSVEDMNTSVPSRAIDGEYMLEQTERRLTIWGAIAQRYRGFVHRSNGWNTDGGFSNKDYNYDKRLYYHAPPDWPRLEGGKPQLSGWKDVTYEDYQ